MNHLHTTRLSPWLRLIFGLALLLGLYTVMGGLSRSAHAQSTLTVTDCTSDAQLQAEVAQANNDNSGDVITFACSGDLKLTGTLTISGSMTLSGNGQHVTLDGGDSMLVFSVNNSNNGNSFTLNALTVAHGSGGLDNQLGNVTISNSTFIYNSGLPALQSGDAGTPSSITITNSTIADNSAINFPAVGLINYGGTATITNSTIADNSGNGPVGLSNMDTMIITNSTIADNSGNGPGIGIDNVNTLTMSGSIVADNTGGSDCTNFDGTFTDNGYNLSSDSSCSFTGTGSLQNTNPKLGPLASYGGPTQTLALLKGSPAIDTIPLASGLCPKTDQRGHKRPDNPHERACDIGAFES